MRGVKILHHAEREPRAGCDRHETGRGPFRRRRLAFPALGEQACKVEFSMEFEFASRALATVLQPVFNRIADSMVDLPRRADEIHGAKG